MTQPAKKKLIEVAIPLEAINAASAREKSIRHGHPSTLHLWWARRPLAACRAVLFSQLVDDPSGYTDELLADPKIKAQAEEELQRRLAARAEKLAAEAESGDAGDRAAAPEPTLADCAAEIERKRLFGIIEELVKWENSTNEAVLERARAEIRRSCGGALPPVYDPFSGGGSIPLEAQRLGLPAYGSDLNPVAVMIGKAMIEIPPRFKDRPPVHPGAKERQFYRNAEGLAEDVRYYGQWMRDRAFERIGRLYPQVDLPKEQGGGKADVAAWIWARTVPSPDPAFAGAQVPIASNFLLSSRTGKEVWTEPTVDKAARSITFRIRNGGTKEDVARAKEGTKIGRAAFRCLLSDAPISGDYADKQAQKGNMGETLIAIVAEGKHSRTYVDPHHNEQDRAAAEASRMRLGLDLSYVDVKSRGTWASNAQGRRYKFTTFKDYFTDRQLVALNTFSDLVVEVRAEIEKDALDAGLSTESTPLRLDGLGAHAYAEAVSIYLGFALSKMADRGSSICTWFTERDSTRNTFARQAIPMTWDFAEMNVFLEGTGSFLGAVAWTAESLNGIHPGTPGHIGQADARHIGDRLKGKVVSTDPPYYDNINYSDLSDFFYVWFRKTVGDIFPENFDVLLTPKNDELIASEYRHESKSAAEKYFLEGMTEAVSAMARGASEAAPVTIYYAFKQNEIRDEGISSTGWATFLQAVIDAGFAVVGTWPIRTELANRMIASGTNALASSVVLVCRKRSASAETVTRADFLRALKRQLPPAIAELQAANIAPADMPQSAIGPGMGVFSRYAAVLESDDSAMSVKTALQLINRELDDYLGGMDVELDADTRFAVTWFEQNGVKAGDYGGADNLARARGISVASVQHAGIVESKAGKVRILRRDELDAAWNPSTDSHLTIWECLQHLIRLHEKDGVSDKAALILRKIGDRAEAVKDLAYRLYDIAANKRKDAKEAVAYNALIADWAELTRAAAALKDVPLERQELLL